MATGTAVTGAAADTLRSVTVTGTVLLDGAQDHAGTLVVLTEQVPAGGLVQTAVLVGLLGLALWLGRRRPAVAASLVLAGTIALAWAATATSTSTGSYQFDGVTGGGGLARTLVLSYEHAGYVGVQQTVVVDRDAAGTIVAPTVTLYPAPTPTPTLPPCTPGRDSDGDRLDDCYETNTGVYVSATNAGTDPLDRDTDDDGIEDGDEVLGTTGGLDLPGLGANPLRKNILLEYDWFDDDLDCGSHSHRPSDGARERFAAMFAAAPVSNPDGSQGITVIQDYGQGGLFSGGNLVPDSNGVIAGGVSGSEFKGIKASNFAANREGYFHYVLLPHRYNTNSSSSGQAEVKGDDLIVSLYCALSDKNVAHTIAHELGHNLGLLHGGDTSCNYKPNYNSVMNYRYQFPGIDDNCTLPGNGILDYSTGQRATLRELDLDESAGICGGVAIDWNGNGTIESGVIYDINEYDDELLECILPYTALSDHDDWAAIDLGGVVDSDRAGPRLIVDCDNPAPLP